VYLAGVVMAPRLTYRASAWHHLQEHSLCIQHMVSATAATQSFSFAAIAVPACNSDPVGPQQARTHVMQNKAIHIRTIGIIQVWVEVDGPQLENRVNTIRREVLLPSACRLDLAEPAQSVGQAQQ
jgi:hypothetical protein